MKRALISVSDKKGIVEFARGLTELGFTIISTGGTYQTLNEAGLKVLKVSDVTGFPEILDGRVKTLHPKIHGGILAERNDEHNKQLKYHHIDYIDLVAVNLYPFAETVSRPDTTLEEAIENIDIGGPSMIRAAAKNYQNVIVVVKPEYYQTILEELKSGNAVGAEMRLKLAQDAFSHTAMYDANISKYLSKLKGEDFPEHLLLAYEKVYGLRYGENPHQNASFYRQEPERGGLAAAEQLGGKELSYNNILDTEAAWALVSEFKEPACVIIKHNNPCGCATDKDLSTAYRKAWECDSISAYGGIVAFNKKVDLKTAELAAEPFVEVIVAPDFDPKALARFKQKKDLRLLNVPGPREDNWTLRSVNGGLLLQVIDQVWEDEKTWRIVTKIKPDNSLWEDLRFAWKVVKHVKSNAIVVARDAMVIGVGAGQMNRVGSVALALEQARSHAEGAVLASDAYFPFSDSIELAGDYGIKAIIQPGGSIRDQESIDECDRLGIAMIFTGTRHFRH